MKQKSKKIKWILCAICAFVFLTCSPLRAEASTGGKSADDAINWVKSQVGKGLDYDGVYGNQCVDLICYYYQYLGQRSPGGNGADYSWNALPSGWQRLQGVQPQKGDILVYSGNSSNPYGHVAIYAADRETYHQNFNSHPYVEKVTYRYNGLSNSYWGVIRPDWSKTVSNNFENIVSSNVSYTTAHLYAKISLTYLTECGYVLGESSSSMQVREYEYPNANVLNIDYDVSGLKEDTTYYYQFYYVSGGNKVWSPVGTFKTLKQHIDLTGIQLNHTVVGLKTNETVPLRIQYLPSNATDQRCHIESADPSIVGISWNLDDGDCILGKKAGVTTITASNGNIKATCKVYVIDPAKKMEGLSIGGRASDAIRLNWKALSGVNGYKIEKYAGSSWTTVADVTNPSTTTYRIENLTPGTEYRFRVSSYTKAEDNGTVLVSDYSTTTEIKAKTSPAIVKNVKIGGTAQDALRINWSKNDTASGYIIEQYKNGSWSRIARLEGNATVTYRVEKLAASTTYKFRMQAFGFDKNTALYSDWAYVSGTTQKKTTTLKALTGVKIGGWASDALRINWNKGEGAFGYIIEQYKNGAWSRIARIEGGNVTTFRVERLAASTAYQFRIQSFAFDGGTPVYSGFVKVNGKTKPSTVSGVKIGGRAVDALRINWNKNVSASGYIIEQYKNGSWVRIARIEGNSTVTYRIAGLQSGTSYKFRIQAFGFDGNTPLYSDTVTVTGTTNSAAGTTNPTAVTGLRIGGTASDAIRLNWNKNDRASGYIIEQYVNGKWNRIARIGSNATTTYRVEHLAKSSNYVFRMQSFSFDGSTPLYSEYAFIEGNTN